MSPFVPFTCCAKSNYAKTAWQLWPATAILKVAWEMANWFSSDKPFTGFYDASVSTQELWELLYFGRLTYITCTEIWIKVANFKYHRNVPKIEIYMCITCISNKLFKCTWIAAFSVFVIMPFDSKHALHLMCEQNKSVSDASAKLLRVKSKSKQNQTGERFKTSQHGFSIKPKKKNYFANPYKAFCEKPLNSSPSLKVDFSLLYWAKNKFNFLKHISRLLYSLPLHLAISERRNASSMNGSKALCKPNWNKLALCHKRRV